MGNVAWARSSSDGVKMKVLDVISSAWRMRTRYTALFRLLIICRDWRRRYQMRPRARRPSICAHATSLRLTRQCTYTAGKRYKGNQRHELQRVTVTMYMYTMTRLPRDEAGSLLQPSHVQQVIRYVLLTPIHFPLPLNFLTMSGNHGRFTAAVPCVHHHHLNSWPSLSTFFIV